MRFLVTGASGFLGGHVTALLEARGDEAVRFSRSTGGDVLDAGHVRRAAEGCEGVFHCAGKVSRKKDDAEELYRVHVDGTRIVLDACEAAGIRRAVVASTSGVVAVGIDPEHVGNENDPPPVALVNRWPYYRAKWFAEQIALAPRHGSLDVVCVNPSLLLGPGDAKGSSTGDVRAFLDGAVLAVPAGGLSFVDVRDAAEAMLLAMDRGRPRERYLVGGCNVTVRDFLHRLSRVSGMRAPLVSLPRSVAIVRLGASWLERAAARFGVPPPVDSTSAEMAQHFWYVDSTKAQRELGFLPRDPNVTLFDTVEDLRARGAVWPRPSGAIAWTRA